MEKTENGCVLLKQKEYDELLKKSTENRAKEIKVTWAYSNLGIMGDFMLADGLYNQIRNILLRVESLHVQERSDGAIRQRILTENYMKVKFSELPWYKRLFFKDKYIQ